jgi:quercetin dioxygenase-like cupin family protein
VLKGTFELSLDGRQVVLREGDSIYLEASLEHRFHSEEGTKVIILIVKMAS